jgi:hypothetical protein
LLRPYWLPRQIGPHDNGFTPRPQLKNCLNVTGGLRRLPPLDLGGRGPETTHEG